MINRHRGEIEAVLDGRRHTLCLTLGGLAGLEAHFGAVDLPALAVRLGEGALSAADMAAILHAGLKGGGHDLSIEEVSEMRSEAGARGFAVIVADLIAATFSAPQPEGS